MKRDTENICMLLKKIAARVASNTLAHAVI